MPTITDIHLLAALLLPVSVFAKQPSAPLPVEAPLRDLSLGQLNFLHTTDSHGWHAGHLQEPSYSADFGDYISFTTRMREKVEADDTDLVVVDTGDRIEGNGLYDASDPKGEYTFDIIRQLQIDVLSIGNHELYLKNSSENEYNKMVPAFRDSYIASNLDIVDPKTNNTVPLAPRYRKFTTKKQGIRICAFGFLFDFTDNANNTFIKPVESAIKEDWFQEVIRTRDIDLFLVIGHAAIRSREFDAIFKAIRSARWDTPIQFFGGHLHVRDYKKFDSKAYGLASGRFMETIGFQSISGLSTGGEPGNQALASPNFARRYIDSNLYSFYHHTGLNESTFSTEHGLNVSEKIEGARQTLELDSTFGCAKKDLWMSRAKYPSNSSIFSWLEEKVLPEVISDTSRADKARLVIVNTGGIRFDILKGPFTRDSTFIVYPFIGGFRYIKDVPYKNAKKVLAILNSSGQILQQDSSSESGLQTSMLAPPEQYHYTEDIIAGEAMTISSPSTLQQILLGSKKPDLTPGYTTKDDDGTDGDDTIHSPISFYRVPNCIQSAVNITLDDSEPELVDFVYIEFIEPWILLALKFAGVDYTAEADTEAYMEGENLTTMLAKWVSENWDDTC